ncbi:MAG: hypothetical protein V1827_01360 [Candidatus Micrarchaeota archaeon]
MSTEHAGRRGQAWAVDFTVGLIALISIIAIYIIIWNSTAMRWNTLGGRTAMESGAFFASESLLATSGEPEGWEMLPRIDGNVSAIGLVNGRNELNRMKLERLAAENATAYPIVKARLGLGRYEFGMRITDLERETTHFEFGRFSARALNDSVSFDRLGILDGQPVIVHMEVWGG